ncbi:MAG TPA: site-specific DNA-methyltransferase [Deltaproteobacteria bacterium]|nr:site-specific DNA-methyltransferase [Deltaproteobacteria bacterium]
MVMLFQTAKQLHRKQIEDFGIPISKVERAVLYQKFADKLIVNPELTRALVSYQANKSAPFYRWLKYKEAFSSELVKYVLDRFRPNAGRTPRVLDPFAGAGTTLTTSSKEGWKATGIELLPIGIAAIRARLSADKVNIKSFKYYLDHLGKYSFDIASNKYTFPHLRITEKAFSKKTEKALSSYVAFIENIKNEDTRYLFWFACLSILEDVSFTRKDGQYLRWDSRSGRSLRSSFNKGNIPDFRTAIISKLHIIFDDLKKRNGGTFSKNVKVVEGSCLTELAKLPAESFDLIMTSPPYCNRYDYTRTYALELAFMGHTEEDVRNLRQTLLSATVENKTKRKQLALEYCTADRMDRYEAAVKAFTNQRALHEVLDILYEAREQGSLNNNNIPNLVENYFFEMNIVIHELSRLLAPGGHVVMVNDNVQYHGEEVPVDLILSDLAQNAGLNVDHIWVLPRGKGNSSQQMGAHGRNEIRKCVYVWSKPNNEQKPS